MPVLPHQQHPGKPTPWTQPASGWAGSQVGTRGAPVLGGLVRHWRQPDARHWLSSPPLHVRDQDGGIRFLCPKTSSGCGPASRDEWLWAESHVQTHGVAIGSHTPHAQELRGLLTVAGVQQVWGNRRIPPNARLPRARPLGNVSLRSDGHGPGLLLQDRTGRAPRRSSPSPVPPPRAPGPPPSPLPGLVRGDAVPYASA